MFRNQYDTDVTTFSPAGRLHQVEYAMEAVKQGSCSVGLKSRTWAVVASLKRSSSELASYQQKIFRIDSHIGIAISGLISDARVLAQWMRNESLNHKYVFNSNIQTERLVIKLSDKSQVYTQKAEKRPYGVGLLVIGADKTGTHLFQTEPSGVYTEFYAQAIGARSQSARTYLEKVYTTFEEIDDEERLIKEALTALKGASTKKLTSRNVSVGIVGVNSPFRIIEGDEIRPLVAAVTQADDEDEEEGKGDNIDAELANVSLADEEEEQRRKDEEEERQAARRNQLYVEDRDQMTDQ